MVAASTASAGVPAGATLKPMELPRPRLKVALDGVSATDAADAVAVLEELAEQVGCLRTAQPRGLSSVIA